MTGEKPPSLGASWDDLRALLAVAECGSLSQAAEMLGLTQPTIGRRLDRLEASVGGSLVRRTTRGCEPTERGAALVPLVARMQEAVDGITRIATTTRNDLEGVVRVATGDLVARYLIRRLPEMLAGAPKLRLEFVTGTDFVSLERGDADIALRGKAPEGESWTVHSLGDIRYGIFAAQSYVEQQPAVLEPGGTHQARWVGYTQPAQVLSARWLQSHIGRAPDFAFSSSLLILEAAAAGAGLAVLPLHIGDDEARLRRIGEPLEGIGFESFLVVHPTARRLERVRWAATRLRRALSGKDASDATQ